MELRTYKVTRTGIYVFKVKDEEIPRIGDKIEVDDKIMKVLDIIGPVEEPFVVAKPVVNVKKDNGKRR